MSRGMILIVDDEPFVLLTLKAILRRSFREFEIETADSGSNALGILQSYKQHHPDYNLSKILILSDWKMPGMMGDELLIESKKMIPEVIGYIITGMLDTDDLMAWSDDDKMKVISKPWDEDQLIAELESNLT